MDKLDKLIELKKEHRNLWYKHGWSCEYFTEDENKQDNKLLNEIDKLQSQGIYCKCSDCGREDDDVDYNSESPNKLMCSGCWNELRDWIKDKCGLC